MREIVLSKTAAAKLENLLHYLNTEWSERVKQNFIQKLDKSMHLIQNYPLVFEKSEINPDLYRCIVTKQTTLFYKFDAKKNIYRYNIRQQNESKEIKTRNKINTQKI